MERYLGHKWNGIDKYSSMNFICWNCGKDVCSEKAYCATYYSTEYKKDLIRGLIYICHKCNAPNIFNVNGKPIIKPPYGY